MLLEQLLEENHLYTPAREKLNALSTDGESAVVDGQAILEELDKEERRRIRYKNSTESFIAYTQTHGYKMTVN